MAIFNAKRLGLKVLVRDEASRVSGHRGALKRIAKDIFFAGFRRLCDGVLAIGTLNREYYLDYGFPEEQIFPVPYTVDNAYFQARAEAAQPKRADLRAELGLDAKRPVILYASKLSRRKHPDDLLATFARLATEPSARHPYLIFVGDGEMESELKDAVPSEIRDSVKFLGFLNQSEMTRCYDLCEVFVLPSSLEPWGLVVNEAMNAGRAVIVSDQVGAAVDLVHDGENGFVFPAGDVNALTEALRRVLDDPQRCGAMGRRSRELIDGWDFSQDLAGLKHALSFVQDEPKRHPGAADHGPAIRS